MTSQLNLPRRNFTSGLMINLAQRGLLSKNMLEHTKRDPFLAYMYAKIVMKGPWKEAESTILHHKSSAYWYAQYCLDMGMEESTQWVMDERERLGYAYPES